MWYLIWKYLTCEKKCDIINSVKNRPSVEKERLINMDWVIGVIVVLLILWIGISIMSAAILYKRVIPRQNEVRVSLDEMADASQWEGYMKTIHECKDFLATKSLEKIVIKSRDGLDLHANFLPAETESKKLAICFHGYTGRGMNDCASISTFFHNLGFNCLIVDNRAHGDSQGDYAGFGILDRYDCKAWVDYINKRFNNSKEILLYGVSMGASTVLMASGLKELADNVKVIVADCAFTSPYEVFAHVMKKDYRLPEFPVMNITNILCKKNAGYGFNDYSTVDAMKISKRPVMFIHGKKDNFVPTWMSEKNYKECCSEKDLLLIDNAGHAACYYENKLLYESKLTEFINKYMK